MIVFWCDMGGYMVSVSWQGGVLWWCQRPVHKHTGVQVGGCLGERVCGCGCGCVWVVVVVGGVGGGVRAGGGG